MFTKRVNVFVLHHVFWKNVLSDLFYLPGSWKYPAGNDVKKGTQKTQTERMDADFFVLSFRA